MRGRELLCDKHADAEYEVHAACPFCVNETRASEASALIETTMELVELREHVKELEEAIKEQARAEVLREVGK